LPDVGDEAAHDATGTLLVLLVPQVIVAQPLPAAAACGVHDATAVGPVLLGAQVVVV